MHSIRGIATLVVFSRNGSLSSLLEAAPWRSSSVFASFSLCDSQFSSGHGYGLSPVVAEGSVVQVHFGCCRCCFYLLSLC